MYHPHPCRPLNTIVILFLSVLVEKAVKIEVRAQTLTLPWYLRKYLLTNYECCRVYHYSGLKNRNKEKATNRYCCRCRIHFLSCQYRCPIKITTAYLTCSNTHLSAALLLVNLFLQFYFVFLK